MIHDEDILHNRLCKNLRPEAPPPQIPQDPEKPRTKPRLFPVAYSLHSILLVRPFPITASSAILTLPLRELSIPSQKHSSQASVFHRILKEFSQLLPLFPGLLA